MDPDLLRLAAVFPSIAVQLRGILSNLHLASAQLAPPAEREADSELDAKAALLDQSYYQLLRLVNNLSATTWLHTEGPLPLCNRDVVRVIGELCQEAESLAAEKGLHFYFRCALSSHLCAIHEEGMEQLPSLHGLGCCIRGGLGGGGALRGPWWSLSSLTSKLHSKATAGKMSVLEVITGFLF